MHSIIILIFSGLASFTGSLQLGPVNLFVINATLKESKANAFWISLGGIIPEFIYCGLAVYAGDLFLSNPKIFLMFRIVLIISLLFIGFIYLFKKHNPIKLNSRETKFALNKAKCFLKGFSLAIMNPQLLPYWMFIMVYFNSVKFLVIGSELDKLAYIIGAGMGAFLLLILIILTMEKYKSKLLTFLNNKYYFKAYSVVFFVIAIQQIFTLL